MGNDIGCDLLKDFTDDEIKLEKFYVYKSLHSDNSWGAVVVGSNISVLPNICFGMKVFAINEAKAISRAREEYEKIHIFDNDKRNIKDFLTAMLGGMYAKYTTISGVMKNNLLNEAIDMNEKYKKHFAELENKKEIKPSPLSPEEMEPLDE